MDENHVCMNFHLSVYTEGAPVYEQKELRQQRRSAESAIFLTGRCAVRIARAERTGYTFLYNNYHYFFERSKIVKNCFYILCSFILILSLTACGADFDGSRLGNDNEFVMEYKIFNKTDSQNLTVTEGDTIHAEIVVEKGSLSFAIQKDDGLVPIYEGKDVSFSDEFDVKIEEGGTYIITVTGEKTRGSVKFTVQNDK